MILNCNKITHGVCNLSPRVSYYKGRCKRDQFNSVTTQRSTDDVTVKSKSNHSPDERFGRDVKHGVAN